MTTEALDRCKESATASATRYALRPRARIHETDTDYRVELEMPGISEADAEITIYKNELRIAGESEDLEFRYERRFNVPETINESGVTATMRFGILNLVLPKAEDVKPKTIKVLAG